MADRSWIPGSLDYAQIPLDCHCSGCTPSNGFPPACRYRDYLLGIIRRLQNTAVASRMRVIGSIVQGKDRPGDVDVVIDLDVPAWEGSVTRGDFRRLEIAEEDRKALSQVMTLARAAYGSLDPFFRYRGSLYVRNDRATGWIPAKHGRAIFKSAKEAGVPVHQVLSLPFVPEAVASATNAPDTSVA